MRPALFILAFCLLSLAVAPAGRAAEAEDGRLEAFFKAYLDEELRQRPLSASRLGDHRFDDRLDDVSPKARAAWAERYRATLAELPKKVEYKKLSRPAQIDYEIFRQDLTRSLWLA